MAHKIDPEKCVGCGACKENCPAGAISEADGKCVIDAATCVRDRRGNLRRLRCLRGRLPR